MTVPGSVTHLLRRHCGASIAVAAALLAGLTAWDMATPSDEIIVLFAAPLAIFALACGFRAGIVAAGAVALFALALGPNAFNSDASRTLILLLIGGPMGFGSDRLAEAQASLAATLEGEASLADSVPEQVWTAAPDGSLDYVNARICEFFGAEDRAVTATSWHSLLHPDDVPATARRWHHSVGTGEPYEATFRLRRHDGEYRSFIGRAVPQRDASGRIVRWCGANVDISDEQARHDQLLAGQRALTESERRYRLLFEHSPHPKWLYDTSTLRFTDANQATIDAYGYSREEFLSMTLWDIRPPEDGARLARTLPAEGARPASVWRHLRKDGTIIDVEVISDDLPGSEPAQRLVLAQDVTERMRTELALRESEERYRRILETASEGIWQIDATRRTTFVNPTMALMLGYTPFEMLGRKFDDFVADGQAAPAGERLRCAFVRKNGTQVETVLSRRLLGDPAGSGGVLAMVSDVTEQMRADLARGQLEAQLVQSQKMESVGQLAGGIAHDFNNLLAVILNYAEFAAEPGSETIEDDLVQIRRAAERAAALTRKLLAFSRKGVTQPEVLDVNALVKDAHQLLERTLGEHIELDTRFAPDTPQIVADPTQIEQVLMNLAVNARDAMPGGGELTLETELHEVHSGDWFGGGRPAPGLYALVRVRDTGFGMSPETAQHAFEPFFTTKAKGEGTGLGLATTYGVVAQAGGHVELTTEPGRGTSVAFILPATSEQVHAAIPAAPPAREAECHRAATILLAEDEEEVRNLAERILTEHGYTVLAARDPLDAVATCEEYDGQIDLLLTDVVMPKMPGPELALRVSERRPDIHVLYMSGYPNNEASPEALDALLCKPFNGPGLTSAVAAALA